MSAVKKKHPKMPKGLVGEQITKWAFDNLTVERKEEILHELGICTDSLDCPIIGYYTRRQSGGSK